LDPPGAETLFRRGLELLPPEDPMRGNVLAKCASAAARRDLRAAEDAYGEAIPLLQQAGDILGAGEAMARLAWVLAVLGQTDRATGLVADAVSLLETRARGTELASAYT